MSSPSIHLPRVQWMAGSACSVHVELSEQWMHSYGFCTPVTQRQVLIKINFQAPKTIQTNY